MRNTTINNIAFQYPDALTFAYNPNVCTVVSTGGGTVSYCLVKCADMEMRIKTYGYTTWDMREMFQVGIKNNLEPGYVDWFVSYTIEVYNSDDVCLATLNTRSYVVWGALRRGEVFNKGRRMAYFKGYPFTFQAYLNGHAGTIMIKNDGKPDGLVSIQQQEGTWTFELPPSTRPAQDKYEICDFDGTMTHVTFDDTFDLTFRYQFNGTFTKLIDVDVMDSNFEHPVYLRWIDRHGFTMYWLFKQGDEQREVKADTEYLRNNLKAADSSSRQWEMNDRRRSYTRQDTLEICAPLVDRGQFDLLQDLTTSPSVERWDKDTDTWDAVTVKSGTYTKTTEDLQDFILQITMAEIPLQSL